MKGDWTGIRRHGTGWRATVSQGRGRSPLQRHFDLHTPLSAMQAWRQDEQAKRRLARKQRATTGMFEADARRYLRAVTAMRSFTEREADILRWIAIFGRKQRASITPADIREWRDRWMTEPRAKDQPPYAASTINHRLRAFGTGSGLGVRYPARSSGPPLDARSRDRFRSCAWSSNNAQDSKSRAALA